jgi:hypothetical protein
MSPGRRVAPGRSVTVQSVGGEKSALDADDATVVGEHEDAAREKAHAVEGGGCPESLHDGPLDRSRVVHGC